MINTLVALTEAAGEESGGPHPWLVGVSIFVVLALMLLALVSFGGGRDHS